MLVPPQGGGVAGSGHGTVTSVRRVAMELATALHHSAQRVEVPREGEVREQHYGLRAQKRPLPGTRPAPLLEVLPQVGAQRHTVDQIVDAVPGLPTLDGPVPQLAEQLVEVPTIVSFSSFQRIMEQTVDIPVP